MTPNPKPHHRAVRRSTALLVATLVIGATPLVARALVAEDAPEPTPAASERRFGEWPVRASTPIPDLGVDLVIEPDAPEPTVPEPATVPVIVLPIDEVALPIDEAPLPLPPFGTDEGQWAALRQCESGGDYAITNPSGKYRGAYQFDRSTWNSVAERHTPELVGVDPAAATPVDQDTVAFALYTERGARPWPHCGRHLG